MGFEISKFFVSKGMFQKALKLYRPPGVLCSETELADYLDFLYNIKIIMGCLMKKM